MRYAMGKRNAVCWGFTLAVVAVSVACAGETIPVAHRTFGPPANNLVCPAAQKFTGGGRVDPGPASATMRGKVTFGFNVHSGEDCEGIKGQLQVVHHPTQTKFHSTEIRRFSSWTEPDGGECGEFTGTVRTKHKIGDWHPHDFEVLFCDYGEPGSSRAGGRDQWQFQILSDDTEGHGNTTRMLLTGGNIQAH